MRGEEGGRISVFREEGRNEKMKSSVRARGGKEVCERSKGCFEKDRNGNESMSETGNVQE